MSRLFTASNLPLLIAGPIVRRVTQTEITVWAALSAERKAKLSVWEGSRNFDTSDTPLFEAEADSRKIGEHLHIALVRIKLPESKPLKPGKAYAYNLTFSKKNLGQGDTSETLHSLGLLNAETRANGGNGKTLHFPLGFEPGVFPAFLAPPDKLEEACFFHASCRLAAGRGVDGMKALGDYFQKAHSGTADCPMPQRLFLTGDQIYADDVPLALLPYLTDLGNLLLFGDPNDANNENNNLQKLEHLAVEGKRYPLTRGNFPSGSRSHLLVKKGGLSTTDHRAHLMGFGEFAAMYCLAWCDDLWRNIKIPAYDTYFNTTNLPTNFDPEAFLDTLLPNQTPPEGSTELDKAFTEIVGVDPKNPVPVRTSGFDLDPALVLPGDPRSEDDQSNDATQWTKIRNSFRGELPKYIRFREATPYVRQAFANVPVFMIFDDHEVTDDWNLNRRWINDVYSKDLGKNVVRNALMAYALFQGWGNDPEDFERDADKNKLLADIPNAILKAQNDQTVLNRMDIAFFGKDNPDDDTDDVPLGATDSPPKINWHYRVPGAPLETLVIDTRTHRAFPNSNFDPPGLIREDILKDQLPEPKDVFPANIAPEKMRVLVVSPVPALGLQTVEDLVQPVQIRIDNLKNKDEFGFFERDFEAWAFNSDHYEKFLARLAPYRRVLLLSGDVHYGITSIMDYWKKGNAEPARFVQAVSSGLKNERNSFQKFAFTMPDLQAVFKGFRFPSYRLGWAASDDAKKVMKPQIEGENLSKEEMEKREKAERKKLSPLLRQKLGAKPAVLPTDNWPDSFHATLEDAEWGWRLDLVGDTRKNEDRSPSMRIPPLSPGYVHDDAKPGPDYNEAINRHQSEVFIRVNENVAWHNNIGRIRFADDEGNGYKIIHDFYCYPPNPDFRRSPPLTFDPSTDPFNPEKAEFFIRHETSFEPQTQVEKPSIN